MKAKVRRIYIETGGHFVIAVPHELAKEMDIHPMDRVRVKKGKKSVIAIVDFWKRKIPNEVGSFEEISKRLGLKDRDTVDIEPIWKPESIKYIIKKMNGDELEKKEIYKITKDIVDGVLSEVEIIAFITAVYTEGMTLDETFYLTKAIAETGDMIKFKGTIADKHSTGGVPGNRTTMIVVPIIASLGYKMPKTSSRAITSPAGTADTMEILAPVAFSGEKLKKIVKKVGGCIAWGGGMHIASADDEMIKIRYPLRIDPEGLLLSSILAKKYAMGATHVVFDIPVGEETKIKTIGEARHLQREFLRLGQKLGMKVDAYISDGNEPIGNGIGPGLEARDVLYVLQNNPKAPKDLKDKSIMIATKLLNLLGEKNPKKKAIQSLKSGRAWKKMQDIIKAQGGNPKIKPEKIRISKIKRDVKAGKKGTLTNSDNILLSKLGRVAGAPKNTGAGIYLHKRFGDKVKKGEKLATIYAGSKDKLNRCFKMLRGQKLFTIS